MAPKTETANVPTLLEEATQSPRHSLAGEGIDPDGILLQGIEGWDSMGMVMFMGLVKDSLSIELSVYDLRECRTVGDLVRSVAKRSAA